MTIVVSKTAQIKAAIAARQDEADAVRNAKVAQGFAYQGHVYQVDEAATSTMTAVFVLLQAGASSPHGGVWRSLDNVNVPMSDAEVRAFILAAKSYFQALLVNAWTLKDSLKSLTSLAAVQAFDINAGWPQ